ncbi:hypothetical protein SmJEL517_g05012 [Synchytrium microbalum]|uniref:Protein kinase domain-containing protein n=1 Tax=Synchytrium microbalum TaxID=1806994 RepID=A0A507BXX5_9FUNG|nr:uncharacterized protein SmJEL517_g05012 [Synchytrium microbalum]TPX31709.1 hypothetical protein SmJEL517_g05012 [Synchytrium microbalum]
MGLACCKEEEIDFTAEVELNHFMLLRSVGKGAFGKVRVVQHKGSNQIYALKYINKSKCIKMKAVENIVQERRLLEEINCTFVCNLRFAFQDDENLFMILDLMLGGDLRFHLDRMGCFKEDMVRFYAAEIACALDYLHSKRIVHRDLKPDNVLLDEKGHAHLTDFNIAVHFKPDKPLTAVAGSMAYMAPEILAKKGYFASVDWWSLGVMLYELAFGRRPFRAKTNEALQAAILGDALIFPADMSQTPLSEIGIDALKGMITRDISQRMGSAENGGLATFRAHPWFEKLNWEKLQKKEEDAPFVPDSKKANFDATHELEELLLEDNPLKVKPRKKNKNGELEALKVKEGEDPAIVKELMVMENKFTVYDCTKINKPLPSQSSTMANTSTQAGLNTTALPQIKERVKSPDTHSRYADVMEGRDHEALNAKMLNNSVDQSFKLDSDSPTRVVPPVLPMPTQEEEEVFDAVVDAEIKDTVAPDQTAPAPQFENAEPLEQPATQQTPETIRATPSESVGNTDISHAISDAS